MPTDGSISLLRAFMNGMRVAPHGKHYQGHRLPKNYGAKKRIRRKMAAKSRARNFAGA